MRADTRQLDFARKDDQLMKYETRHWAVWYAIAVLGLGAVCASFADEHRAPERAYVARPAARGQFYDNRYNHGHYYPSRGYVVRDLPGGYRPYFFHGDRYFFDGGVWYAPGPAGFVVIGPPAGLFVATLPAFYTTVWLGGVPYYYANDVYYQWRADQNGYLVVDPPTGADQPGAPPPGVTAADPGAPADGIYIYPKSGQSADQQAADRFECHDWAKNQTGFDPTQSGGGVPAGENGSKREQYQRAMGACLEARGYSVK
jgi:hypothetical protein